MKSKNIIKHIILLFKGILVGFGAIMPGISGGTLCVSFGMYEPLINVMSHPIKTIRKDGVKLLFFVLGGAIGFIGLAGLADWLLSINEPVVILVFLGFILGTIPDLWKTAGKRGRNKFSYLFMIGGLVVLIALLWLLKNAAAVSLEPGFLSFIFCGILWALSFIVPGLSSSTLIMFFGLYKPMLSGIDSFNFSVIIPLAAGALLCLLAVSRPINFMYNKWHSQMSHVIIGVVLASMVMVVPLGYFINPARVAIGIICVVCGTIASFFIGKLCDRLT